MLETGAASVGANRPPPCTGAHCVNLSLQIQNHGVQVPLLPHFTVKNTGPGRGGVSPKSNCWRFYILGFSTAANEAVVGVGIKAGVSLPRRPIEPQTTKNGNTKARFGALKKKKL